MQIRFRRGKKERGMFGGKSNFIVSVAVSVNSEEQALMTKHDRLRRSVWIECQNGDEIQTFRPTWSELCRGTVVIESDNMNVIFEAEKQILNAAEVEINSLQALESFEGGGSSVGERVYEVNSQERRLVAQD